VPGSLEKKMGKKVPFFTKQKVASYLTKSVLLYINLLHLKKPWSLLRYI
jgi:hypothetical protein